MPISFWARGDGLNAGNANLNIDPKTQQPTTEITFVEQTIGGGSGDLILEQNGGSPDPDTVVQIGGTNYEFTVDLTGTLPTGDQKIPDAYEGKEVMIIVVHDYPTTGETQRLFFVLDGSVDQAGMDDFGQGAVTLLNVDTTPPPTPVCFLRGTLIATPRGEVPVESLEAGDEILTVSGAIATVRFVARRELSEAELLFRPNLRPVCIPAGVMGAGLPVADLWLSPQHRVLVQGWEPEMLFGEAEVLVPAKHLKIAGSAPARPETVEYFHLMLDRHDIVMSNGVATESLFPGDNAIASLTDEARIEMERAFPEFAGDWLSYGPTARRTLTAKEAGALWSKMGPLGAKAEKAVA
ncbi:MAG: Hint domain-containing protein [Paracoccaceae bacterium]